MSHVKIAIFIAVSFALYAAYVVAFRDGKIAPRFSWQGDD